MAASSNINLDHLVYPIMMQIRQLRDLQQDKQFKQIVLNCQNQVECLVLCLMKFTLDYVIQGPNKVDVMYCYDRQKLRKEILLKLQHIQTYMGTMELSKLRRKMQEDLENPEGFSETSSDNEEESFQIKITGHLKEFNPEIQKLRQIIQELNQKLHSYDEKENRRRNSIDQLTTAHIREVQSLKQQIRKQSQDEEIDDYIEVVYFDKTAILEPELQEMMNEKIKNIKQQYDKYIHILMQSRQNQPHNEGLKEHITKTIESYSVKELLKMALEKEPNQYRIWKIIEEIKTYRYLLAVIINQDKSYGIAYKEINELLKCNRQEMKKLTEFRNLMQDTQSQMGAQFTIQIQDLKKQILDLNSQIINQKSNMIQKQSVSQFQEPIQEEQYKVIQQLHQQIIELFNEISSQQHQINQLNVALAAQKQQYKFLQTNATNIFKIIDINAQTFVQFNKCDTFQDKPAIITDIKKKIDNLQPEQSVLYSLYFSQLLHQSQVVQICNQIEIHQQSQQTQTLPNKEEIANLVRLCKLNYQSNNYEKPELTDNYTQTEKQNFQNTLKGNKTEATDIGRTITMINEQIMNSQNQLPSNAFERLLGDSVKLNKRLKIIRPFIEKMSENEFTDLVHIFNTLQIKVSKEIFQLDFSSRVVDLPQQQPTCTESLRVKTLSVPQRINNSKNVIRKPTKSIDSSVINQQANNLFINLEEKREEAQQLFMSTRISSFNKRYARLIPIPLGSKYGKFS